MLHLFMASGNEEALIGNHSPPIMVGEPAKAMRPLYPNGIRWQAIRRSRGAEQVWLTSHDQKPP
jgi:hypothetical protein